MSKEISKIWVRDDVVLITIKNLPSDLANIVRIFEAFASRQINIDLINQTPQNSSAFTDLSFTISEADLSGALELVALFRQDRKDIKVDVSPGNTKITVYGEAMRDAPGFAAGLFRALCETGTEIRLITTSEIDISLLIPTQDEDKAIRKLNEVFDVQA